MVQQAEILYPLKELTAQDAARIPALTHAEAATMAAEEMRRFLDLIGSLADSDWTQPTACALWSVKDVVAHQAAHVVSFTSLVEFVRQVSPTKLRPYQRRGMNFLDSWNQSQVDLRRDSTPDKLIAEISDSAEKSLAQRNRVPGLIRMITLPLPGLDGLRSLGYVFDLIYTRDMWMHRIDICRAVGRPMNVDSDYDRRTVALIVRDLAHKIERLKPSWVIDLHLTGPAGGDFRIGKNGHPMAAVVIDALDFCVLTSGRLTAQEAQILAECSGDEKVGCLFLNLSENRVLF